MSERLRLKKDEPAREAMSCPGCGKPLAVGAVICVQCGYDTRIGRRLDAAGARKPSPVVVAGLALVILAAGAVVFLRTMDDGVEPTPTPPPRATAADEPAHETPAEVEPAAAAEASPAEPESEEPGAPAHDGESTSEAVTSGETEKKDVEPPAPQIDWEDVAARQRERIRMELDRRTPMFEQGEAVELRQNNGLIRRGLFRGVAGDEVKIEMEGNDVSVVALSQLDRNTRLRLDDEYRERYVEYLTRQRIAEMRRAQAAQP